MTKATTYEKFQDRFKAMTDDQLIQAFNEQKSNGWTSTRALYETTLQQALRERHIVLCPKCGKQKIRTPLTNHFEKGKLWHSPWFSFMIPCQNCQKLSVT